MVCGKGMEGLLNARIARDDGRARVSRTKRVELFRTSAANVIPDHNLLLLIQEKGQKPKPKTQKGAVDVPTLFHLILRFLVWSN